jgi:enoyl-CoA hydratase/carnithine racemase
MDYSGYEFFRVGVDDGIAVATINRPETLNAHQAKDHAEYGRLLRDLNNDPDVLVAVVTGAGRTFSVSAPADVMEAKISTPEGILALQEEAWELVHAHIDLRKPIIAAVNGAAIGSALVFALFCDFTIVERHVKMGDRHLLVGLVAGDGMALLFPLTMGLQRAKQLIFTGRLITAEEAERIGLISEVVDRGTSLERAMELARELRDLPPAAVQMTKRALNQWLALGATTTFDLGQSAEAVTFALDGPNIIRRMREFAAKSRT